MFIYVKHFSFLVRFYQLIVKCPFNLFCCSVAKLCLTLCSSMHCSTPGFSVFPPSPSACSNSCPLSRWCHPTMSFSVVPFSSCLQSFPSSRSFPMGQIFITGGQIIGASAPVLPMNIQGWFPLGLTGLISLQSKGLSRIFSSTSLKASVLWCSAFFMVQLWYLNMITGKIIALMIQIFVSKVVSLLFNMVSIFFIAFFPRSKCLLISWLQSPSTVILESKETAKCTLYIISLMSFWHYLIFQSFPSTMTLLMRLFLSIHF